MLSGNKIHNTLLDFNVYKYLGNTVYIKSMDPDGLIWVRKCQVARISVSFNYWGCETYDIYLDPDFGECADEKLWIHLNHFCSIFLTQQDCINDIYRDISGIERD